MWPVVLHVHACIHVLYICHEHQPVINYMTCTNVPASRNLSPPALVLCVLSDPAKSHSDNVHTAI